jgi:uncharacterized protein (TIGR03435 family)
MTRPVQSCIGIGLLMLTASSIVGQGPAAPPAFEVATIKLTDLDFGGMLVNFRGDTFSARGYTLTDLIGYAYNMDNRQIVGGPKWSDSKRYDIVGKVEAASAPAPGKTKLMLQALLAERFRLKVHSDTREMPVYVLTIAKGGSKMKPRIAGDGGPTGMLVNGAKWPGRNTTIQFLILTLGKLVLDRPILDRTGLPGGYDFDLSWRPDPSQFHGMGDNVPSNPDDPDLFTALQEQLGLTLKAQKGPAPVIVVDNTEEPSDN